MNKSPSLELLAASLVAAQAEFPAVVKNAVNPHLHNRYADLGAVIETAKPVLLKYGLAVTQLIENIAPDTIGVTTMLLHSSGQWIESTATAKVVETKGLSLMQVAGVNIAYLRRYSFSAILGLYTGDDEDGNGAGTRQTGNGNGKNPAVRAAAKTGAIARLAEALETEYADEDAVYAGLVALKGEGKTFTADDFEAAKLALIELASRPKTLDAASKN